MLYKEELKKVPPCEIPKATKEELKGKDYIAGIEFLSLQRSGKILIVDYYSIKEKSLQVRFFCDSENYIVYDVKNDKWERKYVSTLLYGKEPKSRGVFCCKKAQDKAALFINKETNEWCYISNPFSSYYDNFYGIVGVSNRFVQEKKYREKVNRENRAENLFQERRNWFPDNDESFNTFCNKKAFKNIYIFFSSLDKSKKRKCTCSKCGNSWKIKENPKHKNPTYCPNCSSNAIWYAERYQSCINENTTVLSVYKHENQLIMRWQIANRTFFKLKPQIRYTDDAYTFYLEKDNQTQPVSYFYTKGFMGWCDHWGKAKRGEICHHKAYVYTDNLTEVFGEKHYNINIKSVMENCNHKIDFIRLLDKLKNTPQTEYLCKLGLTTLASEMRTEDFEIGHSFEKIMGVSKQYLPLYKKMDIDKEEHYLLSNVEEWISEETFLNFRNLGVEQDYYDRVQSILQHMRLQTLCNYVKKQLLVNGASVTASKIIIWLSDYYDMCDNLDIPINKGTVRPRELKKSHDTLVTRYNEVKADIKDKKSKAALEIVNHWFKSYEKNGLCIVVPQFKSDFIREGQALNHCVGHKRYYENHIKGEKMIFFIRKLNSLDTPYVTIEIDMVKYKVLQCYGYGDKKPPSYVSKFANSFCLWIKSNIKTVNRKAG